MRKKIPLFMIGNNHDYPPPLTLVSMFPDAPYGAGRSMLRPYRRGERHTVPLNPFNVHRSL